MSPETPTTRALPPLEVTGDVAEVTPSDLAVAYVTEGLNRSFQINHEGCLFIDGRCHFAKYVGIISESRKSELLKEKNMAIQQATLLREAMRIPFSQIQHYSNQEIVILGESAPGFMTIASLGKNIRTVNATPIREGIEETLATPMIIVKQWNTIRKAVTQGKFTKLQAAAMAKKLGFPEAIALLLNPAISIQKAAGTALDLIGKQQQALLRNQKVLEDIASILRTRQEPELRAYLGIPEEPKREAAATPSLEKDEKRESTLEILLERLRVMISHVKEKSEAKKCLGNLGIFILNPESARNYYYPERDGRPGESRFFLFRRAGPLGEDRLGPSDADDTKLIHIFFLDLSRKEDDPLELQLFDPNGEVILENLITYIRDVLYFGRRVLNTRQVNSLLEPLAKHFQKELKIGTQEILKHFGRRAIKALTKQS